MVPSLAILFLILVRTTCVIEGLLESDRLEEYHKRGYQWPLEKVVPNVPGWRKIMDRRFQQIEQLPDSGSRYDAWMAVITSALVANNFTENGWGLTRAPQHLTQRLQDRLHRNLQKTIVSSRFCVNHDECQETQQEIVIPAGEGVTTEHFVKVIQGEDDARPIMIFDHHENRQILQEMKPIFEWWSGVDLVESTAYGIRAYRNNSNLLMHVDKPTSHIISGIFHVEHSEDSEPWPIVIEDFHGNTNQVYLEAGDLLLYESSKCFHGRPQTFIGSYYANIFLHYRPVEYPSIEEEIHYAIPPHWTNQAPPIPGLEKLEMVGTSFKEPDCKHLLCSLDETNERSKNTLSWHGPALKGVIVTTGWNHVTMTPPTSWPSGYDGGKRNTSVPTNKIHESSAMGGGEL